MRPMSGKIMRVFVLVLVVMMLSASAMAEFSAAVFCPVMKVYFGPSTSSEQIGALRMGTTVTVEASSGDWARINYKGYVGFARVEDLISLEPVKTKTNHVSAILYITPNDLSPRWGTLDRNTTVYLRGMKGDLALISDKNMTVLAYIPMKYIG